jgi:hypothetical protein
MCDCCNGQPLIFDLKAILAMQSPSFCVHCDILGKANPQKCHNLQSLSLWFPCDTDNQKNRENFVLATGFHNHAQFFLVGKFGQ